jgi:hypothetical protein
MVGKILSVELRHERGSSAAGLAPAQPVGSRMSAHMLLDNTENQSPSSGPAAPTKSAGADAALFRRALPSPTGAADGAADGQSFLLGSSSERCSSDSSKRSSGPRPALASSPTNRQSAPAGGQRRLELLGGNSSPRSFASPHGFSGRTGGSNSSGSGQPPAASSRGGNGVGPLVHSAPARAQSSPKQKRKTLTGKPGAASRGRGNAGDAPLVRSASARAHSKPGQAQVRDESNAQILYGTLAERTEQ